jgi:hypothetical protein
MKIPDCLKVHLIRKEPIQPIGALASRHPLQAARGAPNPSRRHPTFPLPPATPPPLEVVSGTTQRGHRGGRRRGHLFSSCLALSGMGFDCGIAVSSSGSGGGSGGDWLHLTRDGVRAVTG